MTELPLVSVIAISYNHSQFLEAALLSVFKQNYAHIELIIIDDASQDKSQEIIEKITKSYKGFISIKTIFHKNNMGNCRTFNEGLALSKGKYIIDFALDDVMLPERISQQVDFLENKTEEIGLVFSNAIFINEKGEKIGSQYPTNTEGKSLHQIPEGNIFKNILEKYYICSPTIMFRRSTLENLGGYDENLSYEDFDILLRASKKYKLSYLDSITTLYRHSQNSLSKKFYQKKYNALLASTLLVLEKAYLLCQNEKELAALAKNTLYHLRQCFFMEVFDTAEKFITFLEKLPLRKYQNIQLKIMKFLVKIKLKTYTLYRFYQIIHYGKN